MIVQVIKKNGVRFQYSFPDDFPDESVLLELAKIKHVFGFNGTVKKRDDFGAVIDYTDPASGYCFDSPDCAVAVVKTTGQVPFEEVVTEAGKPVEVRRLKG